MHMRFVAQVRCVPKRDHIDSTRHQTLVIEDCPMQAMVRFEYTQQHVSLTAICRSQQSKYVWPQFERS